MDVEKNLITDIVQIAAPSNSSTAVIPIFIAHSTEDGCFFTSTITTDVIQTIWKPFYYAAKMCVVEKGKYGDSVALAIKQYGASFRSKMPSVTEVPQEEMEALLHSVVMLKDVLEIEKSPCCIAILGTEFDQLTCVPKVHVFGSGHSNRYPTISLARAFFKSLNYDEAIIQANVEAEDNPGLIDFFNEKL